MKKITAFLIIISIILMLCSCKSRPVVFDGTGDSSAMLSGCASCAYRMTPDELYRDSHIVAVCEATGESAVVQSGDMTNQYALSGIFTDYKMSVKRVIKGDELFELNLRCRGGSADSTVIESNDLRPEKKTEYLMFLRRATPIYTGDSNSYFIINGISGCVKIVDGELEFLGVHDEDQERYREIYNSGK